MKNESGLSDKSEGEFRGPQQFDKIEQEIRIKKNQEKKKQKERDPKEYIDVTKLGPFLSHISQVSNHNLAVAQNYQLLLHQTQTQLQNDQKALYELQQEHTHLQKKYDSHTLELIQQNQDITQKNEELSERMAILVNESHLYGHTLEEKNKIIHDKQQLILRLEKSYQLKEEETKNFRYQKNQDDQLIRELTEEITKIRLEQGEVDRLLKELASFKIQHDEQIAEMKEQVNHFEGMMVIEVREKEKILQQQEPLRNKVEMLEKFLSDSHLQCENLKLENKNLKDQNRQFTLNFQEKLKDEVNQYQQKNIDRIVALEKELHEITKKSVLLEHENQENNIALQEKKSEVEFYLQEYKDMDKAMTIMKDDKETYLKEFQKLKNNYEKVIDKLRAQLRKTQLDYVKCQDDLKNSQMHLNRQVAKIEEMIEMQKFMDIGDRMIQEQAKEEAVQDFIQRKTSKKFENRVEIIGNQVDKFIQEEIQQKEEIEDKEYNSQWDDLFKNIDQIDNRLVQFE